jgi:hypothetical protein
MFAFSIISLYRPSSEMQSYPCNRPGRPIGLWDVEAPTFSRQSAHRWRWGCQLYAPAARKIPGTHFSQRLSRPQGHSAAERIRSIERIHLIGNRTHDLPACSMMPQATTLLYRLSEILMKEWRSDNALFFKWLIILYWVSQWTCKTIFLCFMLCDMAPCSPLNVTVLVVYPLLVSYWD